MRPTVNCVQADRNAFILLCQQIFFSPLSCIVWLSEAFRVQRKELYGSSAQFSVRQCFFFPRVGRRQQQSAAVKSTPATHHPFASSLYRGSAVSIGSALRESDRFVSPSRKRRASSRPPKQSAIGNPSSSGPLTCAVEVG